mmetsp:Transcript_62297/g.99073  ORF Transcript_62297/g.99073 Transcript_62297/m.99073 type:complete len:105 (+) Transcript_62297:110-424(+)
MTSEMYTPDFAIASSTFTLTDELINYLSLSGHPSVCVLLSYMADFLCTYVCDFLIDFAPFPWENHNQSVYVPRSIVVHKESAISFDLLQHILMVLLCNFMSILL